MVERNSFLFSQENVFRRYHIYNHNNSKAIQGRKRSLKVLYLFCLHDFVIEYKILDFSCNV